MAGQMVHIEIPADDTAASREFWGSLFGWEFNAFPGPSEYHMTRLGEQQGGAITNMEPGKRGTRVYFDVEDIKDVRQRSRVSVARWASRCRCPVWAGS
jgi:predicted enzyme related to lactoylglutathione lyase